MDRLIYTAVSGATRSLNQQAINANNLSNINSQGFRADLEGVQAKQITGAGYNTRYLVQEINGGVNMAQGNAQVTGRDLDIAIQGSGLIALGNGRNEVYTRNGHIEINRNGSLTINGLPVLGDAGPIVVPRHKQVSIGSDGTLTVIPADSNITTIQDVDRIKLVDIAPNNLSKNPQGFLLSKRNTIARSEAVQVVSRHLEGSNVSAIREMVSSIAFNRQFEAQIKMMKVAEELAKTGNSLIRVS